MDLWVIIAVCMAVIWGLLLLLLFAGSVWLERRSTATANDGFGDNPPPDVPYLPVVAMPVNGEPRPFGVRSRSRSRGRG